MVYEVHGYAASGNTARVLIVLAQLNLLDDEHFKLIPPSSFAECQTDEYRSHQPFAQIPWMKDTETGVELYESRAICRYLALKHKSPLLVSPPSSPSEYHAAWTKFEMAASSEITDFDFNVYPLARELVTMPMLFKIPGNEALIAWHKKDLNAKLKGYDLILGKQKYLAGDELSLIDLFTLPFAARAEVGGGAPGLSDGSFPNVARWWKEITSLPAWAQAQALAQPPK